MHKELQIVDVIITPERVEEYLKRNLYRNFYSNDGHNCPLGYFIRDATMDGILRQTITVDQYYILWGDGCKIPTPKWISTFVEFVDNRDCVDHYSTIEGGEALQMLYSATDLDCEVSA